MQEAARNFNEYLSLALQKNTKCHALAYYNLAYIALHKKDYATAQDRFEIHQLQKNGNATVLADAYNRIGDCYMHVRPFRQNQTILHPGGKPGYACR